MQNARVLGAERVDEGFRVRIGGPHRRTVKCRRLLLATGLEDRLPDLPGLREQYGVRVHHCPYCDAYEHRGRRLAAYGKGAAVAALARRLANWSEDVLVCATGRLGPGVRAGLEARGITVEPRRLLRLEGTSRTLRLVFERGAPLVRDAMFVAAPHSAASALAVRLGSLADRTGCLITDRDQSTRSPGLYAAGDADARAAVRDRRCRRRHARRLGDQRGSAREDARESSRAANTAGASSKSASTRRT
jgi:thioredoxin reductase